MTSEHVWPSNEREKSVKPENMIECQLRIRAWTTKVAHADLKQTIFTQRVHCIFKLLVLHGFYSKSLFRVKLSEMSREFEWNWMKLNQIESIWIKISSFLLKLIQFRSSLLVFFVNVHSIFLRNSISSKNDEQPTNWKCSKPVAWVLNATHKRFFCHPDSYRRETS